MIGHGSHTIGYNNHWDFSEPLAIGVYYWQVCEKVWEEKKEQWGRWGDGGACGAGRQDEVFAFILMIY